MDLKAQMEQPQFVRVPDDETIGHRQGITPAIGPKDEQ